MFVETRKYWPLTVVFVLLSHDLNGQTAFRTTRASLTRALELHESAVALYAAPKRAAEAAGLHIEEAQHRASTDPEAVEALIMAGNLFNYAQRPVSARRTLEQAAERALAMGDVRTAAQAYLNAAFIAHESGNRYEVQRLGRKAVLLMESPLLEPRDRSSIRNRFKVKSAFAALFK